MQIHEEIAVHERRLESLKEEIEAKREELAGLRRLMKMEQAILVYLNEKAEGVLDLNVD